MGKHNDVRAIGKYVRARDADKQSEDVHIYWFNDGTVAAHENSTDVFMRDGEVLDPDEMYGYLRGLAGYTGLRRALATAMYDCWKECWPGWIWFSKKSYERIGVPEMFHGVPKKHAGLWGENTPIVPGWYMKFKEPWDGYDDDNAASQPKDTKESISFEANWNIEDARQTMEENKKILAMLNGSEKDPQEYQSTD